ncbi:hypothetical protein MRX96_015632 [Rhipicephalus microplus]|nr:isoinhibitor K-like [Rhipicephalus microplus]
MYLNSVALSRANFFKDDQAASHVSTMHRMSALAVLLLLAISLQNASAHGKPSLCYLPRSRGLCYAYFPSYYYDSSSGTCQDFIYGGCQGNENRFSSREECLRTCG